MEVRPGADTAMAGSVRCLFGFFPALSGDLRFELYEGWFSMRYILSRTEM